MPRKVLMLVPLVIFSCVAVAETPAQVSVEVIHSGQDSVGQQLVFYYKEAIRSSASFHLTLGSTLGFRVRIVTLDPSEIKSSYSTVYSATWTWNNPEKPFDFYLTQYVGTCGANRVRSCAEDLLVATNTELEKIQRILDTGSR